MRIATLFLVFTIVILSLGSCEQEVNSHSIPQLPDTLYNYSNSNFPKHFSQNLHTLVVVKCIPWGPFSAYLLQFMYHI